MTGRLLACGGHGKGLRTWDTGPFGDDTATDFCGDLDEPAERERAGMIRDRPPRAVEAEEHLGDPEAGEAVAASAMVAARCPGGDPPDPHYGPERPLPDLAAVRDLAAVPAPRVRGRWGRGGVPGRRGPRLRGPRPCPRRPR
ncbi:DUF4259 domain-containing protein [Nocardiopsis flavescens]|uniref:DUF4259 domain-containing protein n=1 Tax=Nocardiopsis flavescens TaxID=758803 RepID=UPI000934BB25